MCVGPSAHSYASKWANNDRRNCGQRQQGHREFCPSCPRESNSGARSLHSCLLRWRGRIHLQLEDQPRLQACERPLFAIRCGIRRAWDTRRRGDLWCSLCQPEPSRQRLSLSVLSLQAHAWWQQLLVGGEILWTQAFLEIFQPLSPVIICRPQAAAAYRKLSACWNLERTRCTVAGSLRCVATGPRAGIVPILMRCDS